MYARDPRQGEAPPAVSAAGAPNVDYTRDPIKTAAEFCRALPALVKRKVTLAVTLCPPSIATA